MQSYILLTIDNSVFQISLEACIIYFMMVHCMVIIMNNIHYMYKYDKLKYVIFLDSLLAAMRY